MSPDTSTASGHRRSARATGIAVRTPKARASYEAVVTTLRRSRPAADDHRPAPQRRVARLLDRREEGVHVDVEDGGLAYEHTFVV